MNLPPEAMPWGRYVQGELGTLARAQGISSQNSSSDARTLNAAQDRLAAQIERLNNAADVQLASVGTSWNGVTTWVTGTPSVTSYSISGKFLVTVSGGSSGGSSFLTFSAPGYDRERAKGAGSAVLSERVSVIGGISSPGSGSRSWIATFPPNSTVTFTAEGFSEDSYASLIGMQIQVQPLL